MVWTFNAGLPTLRDRVRLHIGDTNSGDPQLADETLDALLVLTPDQWRVAAQASRVLAAKYAREVDRDIRDTTIREGDREAHYLKLAAQFDAMVWRVPASPRLRPAWPCETDLDVVVCP